MILMIQEVLAHLGSHGGRIINIGSGRERQPGSVIYSATKGAVATCRISESNSLSSSA
jgi:NAD(P)-dependent dehydrogenase (short-subunit alcohol dehydrogenase family)